MPSRTCCNRLGPPSTMLVPAPGSPALWSIPAAVLGPGTKAARIHRDNLGSRGTPKNQSVPTVWLLLPVAVATMAISRVAKQTDHCAGSIETLYQSQG